MTESEPQAIVVARKPPKQRFDLRVGEWGFHINLNTGKLEIYRANRPDLAHLIIMWGTRSGDVDVHLTYLHEAAMSNGSSKDYESLFTIPQTLLEAAGIHMNEAAERIMVPRLLTDYRKFSPGWLAASGYVVVAPGREAVARWVTSLAPKSRGKHRLEPRLVLDPETYPREFVDNTFDPRVLRYLEADERDGMVQAIRIRRGRVVRRDGIILKYTQGPNGTMGWWGMKQRDLGAMANAMSRFLFDQLVLLVRPEHAEKWEQIVTGLGMDDLEETRTAAHGVRQFLRTPRNPVGLPSRLLTADAAR